MLSSDVIWALIHDSNTDGPNEWGENFLLLLHGIYEALDMQDKERVEEEKRAEVERLEVQAQVQYLANLQKEFVVLTPESFSRQFNN